MFLMSQRNTPLFLKILKYTSFGDIMQEEYTFLMVKTMSTKLWYNEFNDDWMWALPLGNGRIGAMLYGNPHCEQIEIN